MLNYYLFPIKIIFVFTHLFLVIVPLARAFYLFNLFFFFAKVDYNTINI